MNMPFPVPDQGILPSRFKVINYADAKTIVLWDMGDIIQKKRVPQPWATAEYRDPLGYEFAKKRMSFLCGLLNGSRPQHEVADIA